MRKSDMSVEAIKEAIHQFMYEKYNDSPETEEESQIRHIDKRKTKSTKEQTDRNMKYRKVHSNRCGAHNWSKQQERPAKGKKCVKSRKMGRAEEYDWTPDRIHSIQQKIHSLSTNGKNNPPFYTATLLVNNRPIKFTIDTGSPVTLIPKSKFNNTTVMKPVT